MCNGTSLEYSAMAVVFYNGRILVTWENIFGNVVLSLPKGHIERGETAVDAAIRECFEETNVKVMPTEVITELSSFEIKFTTPSGKDVRKVITPILFETKYKGNPQPLENRILKVEYMHVNDFFNNCSYDNVKQTVTSALNFLINAGVLNAR